MEVNPDSPVIASLRAQFEADPAGGQAAATAELLYETALLTSGFNVESPKEFAGRIYSLISSSGGAPAAGGSSGSGSASKAASPPSREEVTPEVMADNDNEGGDPWRV